MDKKTEVEVLSALAADSAEDLWEFQRILKDYHFKYEPAKKIFALLNAHWKRSAVVPSKGLMKAYLRASKDKLGPDLYSLCLDTLESSWGHTETRGARGYVVDFITAQEINQMNRQIEDLKLGDHQGYIDVMSDRIEMLRSLKENDVEKVGQLLCPFSKNFLENWATNVDKSYGGIPTTTGFPRFDELTSPLYPGELGMFLAPTGRGKSLWMVNVAFHLANELGLRVMYVGLDNLAAEFCERFLTLATQLPIEEMKKKYSKSAYERAVNDKYNQLYGDQNHRVVIQSFPRKSVTIKAVERVIKTERRHWIKEDREAGLPEDSWGKVGAIIIDYSDLLQPTERSNQEWINLEAICNDMSALGQTELCPMWTASQTNRSSVEKAKGNTQEYHVSGGWGKLAPIRKGVAMQQTKQDRLQNYFGAYLFKGTRSDVDIVFPMGVDYKRQRMFERDDVPPYRVTGQLYEEPEDNQKVEEKEFMKSYGDPIVHDVFGEVSSESFKK